MTRNRDRSRNIRLRMWRKNPHCYYCGIKTIWVERSGGTALPHEATIEHLRSRLNPTRTEPCVDNKDRRITIACYKCNHERAELERQQIPVEEWRRRTEEGQLRKKKRVDKQATISQIEEYPLYETPT